MSRCKIIVNIIVQILSFVCVNSLFQLSRLRLWVRELRNLGLLEILVCKSMTDELVVGLRCHIIIDGRLLDILVRNGY